MSGVSALAFEPAVMAMLETVPATLALTSVSSAFCVSFSMSAFFSSMAFLAASRSSDEPSERLCSKILSSSACFADLT